MKNPFQLRKLHVFTNEIEWYVAFDPEDAIKAFEEFTGDSWDYSSYEEYYKIQDDVYIKVFCELDNFDDFKKHAPLFSTVWKDDQWGYCKAKAWLWVLNNGRGFLCSSEY
jgi:hypothetical protein